MPIAPEVARMLPLNCPHCGARLTYVASVAQAHFYRCPRQGTHLMITPDGKLEEDVPANVALRAESGDIKVPTPTLLRFL